MNNPQKNTGQEPKPKRQHSPIFKALKWTVLTIISLLLLILLIVGIGVWILTPQRLTPIVQKYASEYIDGNVNVKRVELTYWSTFPHLKLEIDSLEVISGSLKGISDDQRAKLPANADTLLKVNGFSGEVNILKLLTGTIALHDITIDRPQITIVDVDSATTNYAIFPPSETTDTTSATIPDITLSRFRITGDAPIHYVSLRDSIDFDMTMSSTEITGKDAPSYRLDFAANAGTRIGIISIDRLSFGLGGDIIWDNDQPYRLTLSKFQAGINDINTIIDTSVDFSHDMIIESLRFVMQPAKVNSIISIIPPQLRGELGKIKNNLQVGLNANLTAPWSPSTSPIPSIDLEIDIPEGSVTYEQLKLSSLAISLKAAINGTNPNASRIELRKLLAIGESVGFSLNATATDIMSDPLLKGHFEGGMEFSRIPAKVLSAIGYTLQGRFLADADFDLRLGYLNRANFHRIKLDGNASLNNFRMEMPENPVTAYIRHAGLKFGTSSKIKTDKATADSLMTVTLDIDTAAVTMPGMDTRASGLRIALGAKNIASSADTTLINPIGGNAKLKFFSMLSSEDSTRVRLRDISVTGSLRRFRDNKRVPVLSMNINAGRIRYSDRLNRASLRQSDIAMTLHPTPPRIGRRLKAAIDSINAANPGLPPDTLIARARRAVPRRIKSKHDTVSSASTHIDFELDNDTRSLLRRWRASGHLKAKRARFMTPYFPLRNIFSDIDIRFNNDSITVHNTRYRVGRSDFLIDGSITNLARAVTSRTGRQALMINFRLTSDTIDVNQIAAAVFAGAAFAEHERQGAGIVISDSDSDEIIQASIDSQTDNSEAGPLLIPTNIEATLRLAARNVMYSDFLFHNFRGSAEIFDGALNLRNLSARADVGGIDLTALYQGLHPDSLSFAFGMQVRDFKLGRFMELVPALDTIMPLMRDIKGTVNAEVAATTRLDTMMNLNIPSLNAAVNITGDSLVLIDAETFRKIGKWLLFKNKNRNVIDRMNARLVVKDSRMELFPFIFNIDRYKLGVFGTNDLDLNFKYHVAVLKSPIPFKFGINVSGNPDKMKIRLGGAKVNEKKASQSMIIADTTRINLLNQIESLFRRGVKRAGKAGKLNVNTTGPSGPSLEPTEGDTISHADSLVFIREGLIPAPVPPDSTIPVQAKSKKKKK